MDNAGYPRGNGRAPLPEILDIKLTVTFLLCKRILPIMVKQK